jgi:dTDP-4-dehydrorhamnose reductase
MIVALTGSNGFLGNKFLKNYKKNFKKIISLPSATINKNIKFYKHKSLLRDFLIKNKVDVLIHFAGIRKKDCELNKINAENSILKFTEQLVNGINKTKKKIQFIYISTDHVFDGNSKSYKENNNKNLKPNNSLGIFKLKAERYVIKNSSYWTIIRLSAVMDDIRLSKFVIDSINNKKKISLYTNIFFSPVLSSDLFKVIKKIIHIKLKNKIIHCSGNKRINKYDFYLKLIGKKNYFLKEKARISNFHPKDLSLSNKSSSVLLNYKFTNFESSVKQTKKILSSFKL